MVAVGFKPTNLGNLVFLKWYILGRTVSLGHIDDHLLAPDDSCGIRTHDSWLHEAWPLLTAPSMPPL